MKKFLRSLTFLFLVISSNQLWAQVPTISYATPKVYTAGVAIATLSPTSTGVAAPNYSSTPTTLGSGFSQPAGVAVDAAGNVYVASYGSNQVFKIPAGNGTPVAIGSGFFEPNDVKVDAAGNVYVADQGNNAVKKIPVGGGAVVTLGSGFSYPSAIAVDKAGNVYVADPGNGAVKEIPVAGGAPVVLGNFNNPFGVAVDGHGVVYVSDATFDLYEIPPGGGAPVVLLSGLNNPNGIWADPSGDLFVTDSNNSVVKMLPAGGGALVTLPYTFDFPFEVTTDAAGNVYVGDPQLTYIQKFNITGGYQINTTLPAGMIFNSNTGAITGTPTGVSPATNYTVTGWNTSGSASATVNIKINLPVTPSLSYATPNTVVSGSAMTALSPTKTAVDAPSYATPVLLGSGWDGPEGVAVDAAGNVYVADAISNTLKKIPAGNGTPVILESGFNLIGDVAVDKSGNLYVTDYFNNEIKEFVGGTGSAVILGSGFYHPYGVAVDAAGNVYVGDQGNNQVKKIPVGNKPVVVLASNLYVPDDLTVDAAGNVFFADLGNNAIKEIPVGGGAPIIVGTGFTQPLAVAVDAAGNLFVTDRNNNAIKEIYAGTNTTVTISTAVNFPFGIAVDTKGDIFVGDYGENEVKEIKPTGGYFINALPPGLSFAESTGVISGTPQVVSAATSYTVTGYNVVGSAQTSLTIGVAAPPAASALSALAVSNGSLNPTFLSSTTNYAVSATNALLSIKFTPTVQTAGATVTINGKAVASGAASQAIPLVVGQNTVKIIVTAPGNTSTTTYTVLVTRQLSTNDNLSALALSSGTLTPTFTAGTLSYKATVSNATASITVTPTAAVAGGTITVNGTAVTSGSASGAITLNYGANNTITVNVIAPDGVTIKNYVVAVTRTASSNANLSKLTIANGTLTPAFAAATITYSDGVGNGLASTTVTPTVADSTATVTVNGTAVASGSASQALPLVVGANTVSIVVKAQDGTTKTYTITVNEAESSNANLSGLKPGTGSISPVFSATTTAYTESVAGTVSSITITPTTAVNTSTVKVNGTAVPSGTASAPIALKVGSNVINTVVTAQNGTTTKTYTLTVTRVGSTNALLSALKISKGALAPVFASTTTSYTASVVNGVTSMTVTPTVEDTTATIKVNGTAVASGSASGAITLAVGSNTITTVVTAQDGVTTKTYTLVVTRAASGADSYDPGISVAKPEDTPTLANDGIQVHQAVSPNGDGINDFLQIDNINQYPENKLAIINRNGQMVFEATGYDNSTKVFDGHSSKNGQMQLPGTYFYQLDYTVAGITKHKTGYIVLKY